VARSRYHCCRGRSNTRSVFPCFINGIFSKKIIELQVCVLFLLYLQICRKRLSFWDELSKILSKMYKSLHVKYTLLLSDFNETWIFSTDFRKIIRYEISWKSVIGIRVVPCGRIDRQTKKKAHGFRNFVNAAQNGRVFNTSALGYLCITACRHKQLDTQSLTHSLTHRRAHTENIKKERKVEKGKK
jgi:hypothetical protein